MRNILVFPDGSTHDFMYPVNRTIGVGERLTVELEGNRTDYLKVVEIDKRESEVLYRLSYD